MSGLLKIQWAEMFFPGNIAEIVLRGSIVYLALFALLRFILRRQSGTVGITDLLVVVLIADAAQNAMANDYHSVTDGIVLVTTIIFWSFTLDWLGYRFPRIQRFVHPEALPLVWNGRLVHRNLEHELITEDELMSQLRLQGVEDLTQVHAAYMEGDGRISVITREEKNRRSPKRITG